MAPLKNPANVAHLPQMWLYGGRRTYHKLKNQEKGGTAMVQSLCSKLQNVDIVQVIAHFLRKDSLKKRTVSLSGPTYAALCPFHTERTPSFIVMPSSRSFHCFGCGEGGDVLHFVCRYKGMSVPDALEAITRITGVKLLRGKTNSARARRRDREKTRALH